MSRGHSSRGHSSRGHSSRGHSSRGHSSRGHSQAALNLQLCLLNRCTYDCSRDGQLHPVCVVTLARKEDVKHQGPRSEIFDENLFM